MAVLYVRILSLISEVIAFDFVFSYQYYPCGAIILMWWFHCGGGYVSQNVVYSFCSCLRNKRIAVWFVELSLSLVKMNMTGMRHRKHCLLCHRIQMPTDRMINCQFFNQRLFWFFMWVGKSSMKIWMPQNFWSLKWPFPKLIISVLKGISLRDQKVHF